MGRPPPPDRHLAWIKATLPGTIAILLLLSCLEVISYVVIKMLLIFLILKKKIAFCFNFNFWILKQESNNPLFFVS